MHATVRMIFGLKLQFIEKIWLTIAIETSFVVSLASRLARSDIHFSLDFIFH